MRGRVATLLIVVAIAISDPPFGPGNAGLAFAAPQKAKPRTTRRAATKTPKPAATDPSPVPSPSPRPLESQTGPRESDVARLARVRARREAVEREILKLQGQTESTLRDLDSIDLDLRLAAHRYDEAELEFKETTRLLDATIRDVQATKAKIEATRPRVLKSLTALSKLGELSYARLLFSLDDPADILRGYRYVSRIASADGDQIKGFKSDLVQLSSLEEQLKRRTAENLETRRRLGEARIALASRKTSKEARIEEIAQERQLQEALALDYQKREADLLQLLGETGQVGGRGKPSRPRFTPSLHTPANPCGIARARSPGRWGEPW